MFGEDEKNKKLHISGELKTLIVIREALGNLEKTIKSINIENVSVDNIDYVKKYLREELAILAKKVNTTVNSIHIPESLSVSNFEIKVEDLKTLIETINDLRAILAQVDFKPTIDVKTPEVKIPEIKVPKAEVDVKIPPISVPEPKVTIAPKIDLSNIIKALNPLRYLSNKASQPLAVRMSDGKKFIRILKDTGERMVTAFANAPGMTTDDFKTAYKKLDTASGIVSARKTVATAGTAVQLITARTLCFRVDLSADLGNTNPVVVGGSAVVAASDSQKGIVLIPGNDVISVLIDDVSKLYVDAQTNGDSVCFNYYTR